MSDAALDGRSSLLPSAHLWLWVPACAGTTRLYVAAQPRAAIEPGEIAVVILRGLRAHDGVAQPCVLAGGVVDVLADRARHQLHARGARKAVHPVTLQRGRAIVRMLRQHVRQADRILHRLAGAL